MQLLAGLLAAANLCSCVAGDAGSAFRRMRDLKHRREERIRSLADRNVVEPVAEPLLRKRSPAFLTSKSQEFAVNASELPDIDWDIGESYAGLLPISDHPDETRKLFFWFFPSAHAEAKKEITIWLQGGPGGASTGGLMLENGPILDQPGTVKPRQNTFSWTNLTNMVWIDQPVGTGFSVGTPNITNEFQLTDQFMGFWKNFIDTFSMQGYKVYLTGESYAGYYIPYIANGFLEANDAEYYNFKGAAINDPIIGNEVVQFEVVAMQYLNTWSQAFGLNAETMAKLAATNEKCGYDTYIDKYFRFPPPAGPFPGPFGNANFGTNMPTDCNIQGEIIEAVTALNPCFNEDHIFDTCPLQYSPLGVGLSNYDFNPPGPRAYYNRPEVVKALHASPNVTWGLESSVNVFVGKVESWEVGYSDVSLPPAQIGIVSKMIEATNNIIVGVGGLDFQLPANGTLFVFQNMTWGGKQGFTAYPNNTLFVPKHPISQNNSLSGYGDMGLWTEERGLTFYLNYFAGHEGPWYTPGVNYRVIQKLLGQIPSLSATDDF